MFENTFYILYILNILNTLLFNMTSLILRNRSIKICEFKYNISRNIIINKILINSIIIYIINWVFIFFIVFFCIVLILLFYYLEEDFILKIGGKLNNITLFVI